MREDLEAVGLFQRRARRVREVGEKLLKVGIGGRAIDPQRVGHPVLLVLELRRMAGRAGHADLARCGTAVDHEADRQPERIGLRLIVGKISVALQ